LTIMLRKTLPQLSAGAESKSEATAPVTRLASGSR